MWRSPNEIISLSPVEELDMEETKKYVIALSPRLGISPAEFMERWNGIKACTDVAEADTEQDRGIWPDSQSVGQVVVILEGIVSGVASNFIYDLIQQVVSRRRIRVKPRPGPSSDSGTVLEVLPDEDEQNTGSNNT